jgi:hypothetical protein
MEMETIKEMVTRRKQEMLEEIQFYISQGIDKDKATEMTLKETCLGAGVKAQIRYEVKSM